MTRSLRLEPLTAEAFAPFGDVVDPPAVGQRISPGETLVARAAGFSPPPACPCPLGARAGR